MARGSARTLPLVALLVLLLGTGAGVSLGLDRLAPEGRSALPWIPELHGAWRSLALGQYGLAADVTWVRARLHTDRSLDEGRSLAHLAPLYDAVTTFDPYHEEAYVESALLLTGLVSRPDAALRLLRRGEEERPDSERIPWNISMIEFLENGDAEAAAAAARRAAAAARRAERPVAAGLYEDMAARMGEVDPLRNGYRRWRVRLRRVEEGAVTQAGSADLRLRTIRRKLRELRTRLLVQVVDRAARAYREREGRWPADPGTLLASGDVDRAVRSRIEAYPDADPWPEGLLDVLRPERLPGLLREPPVGGRIRVVEGEGACSDVLRAAALEERLLDVLDRSISQRREPPRDLDELLARAGVDPPPWLAIRWDPPLDVVVEPIAP